MTALGECYKQLDSSVGDFGTATLTASTNAIESTSPGDATFTRVDSRLRQLGVAGDALAGKIKGELAAAAFEGKPVPGAAAQMNACQALIGAANGLASSS